MNIAKRLAAIYYTAVHWEEKEWVDFVESIGGNLCDIAYDVGGMRMIMVEIPKLVEELNRRLNKENGGN